MKQVQKSRRIDALNSILFDTSTFGITGKSLKQLKNFLCQNYKNDIAVVQIPTGDITCGFLIIDKFHAIGFWTGDGFRTDRGGEGGRGYQKAEQLIALFGLEIYEHDKELLLSFADDEPTIERQIFNYINEKWNNIYFETAIPKQRTPKY